ncbi:cell division protein FtsL [Candidatus Dependentiae bacterium]|nr:cell division protein FtsL [Candidatus Dependentiae bacterium]
MNAVARVALAENTFTKGVSLSFSLSELRMLFLMILCLVSALGVIYVKDLNRRLSINNQKVRVETEYLQSESNKLLLEHSAWGAQSRVQQVAQHQLAMQIPLSSEVVMIKI